MKNNSFKERLSFGILSMLNFSLNEEEKRYAIDINGEYDRIMLKKSNLSASERRDVVQAYAAIQNTLDNQR